MHKILLDENDYSHYQQIFTMTITDRIKNVRQDLQDVGRKYHININSLKLLAVSKTHPASAIQAAFELGITDFGESYLNEALEKIQQLKRLPLCWHFIGPMQSNKTKPIAENFDWVQSVDRKKILLRLSEQRPEGLKTLNICIQINYFNEPQKKGAQPNEIRLLLELAEQLPNIKLRGLMAIAPKTSDRQTQILQYQQIATCYAKYQIDFPQMDTLSIGMSGDFEAAIAAGSNMIRIGSAIFGQRHQPITY